MAFRQVYYCTLVTRHYGFPAWRKLGWTGWKVEVKYGQSIHPNYLKRNQPMKSPARLKVLLVLFILCSWCQHSITGEDEVEKAIQPLTERQTIGANFTKIIVANPFLYQNELADDYARKWVGWQMVVFSLARNDNEAVRAALIRVAYKNPPQQLMQAGTSISDQEANRYLAEFFKETFDIDMDDVCNNSPASNDSIDIDIGNQLINIPFPKGFIESQDHSHPPNDDRVIIRFIEKDPPRRMKGAPIPEFRIGVTSEISFKQGNFDDIKKIYHERIRMKYYLKQFYYYLAENFASSVVWEGNELNILSLLNIHKRIIVCTTIFPNYSIVTDYARATKMHEQWRNAIIEANQ